MKRRWLTGLGIAEVGALALLWRSAKAAPLVASEDDIESVPALARSDSRSEQAARAV
jgi:hypothetical protein